MVLIRNVRVSLLFLILSGISKIVLIKRVTDAIKLHPYLHQVFMQAFLFHAFNRAILNAAFQPAYLERELAVILQVAVVL